MLNIKRHLRRIILDKNGKKILKNCMDDEYLLNVVCVYDKNNSERIIKRLIKFIITQLQVYKQLRNTYNKDIELVLEKLVKSRIILLTKEVHSSVKLQKLGVEQIIEGAKVIKEGKTKVWNNLSQFEKFKRTIFSIQFAEYLFDSMNVFPPELYYYKNCESAQILFFKVFNHVFEIESWNN